MLRPCSRALSFTKSFRVGSTCSRRLSSQDSANLSPLPQTSPIQPPPASSHHSSLATFLEHAHTTGLSTTSTTYIGTYYEYLCSLSLAGLGFSLTRTGGRSDGGVDLVGTWHLPSLPHPLRCIVQCKNLKAKAGPNLIRELEGAFVGAPTGWRGEGAVGVLCAGKEATKGVREAVRDARRGLVWCQVDDVGAGVGRVRQMLWNRRVSEMGAEGVSVRLRYLPGREGADTSGLDKEVVLTWKGDTWEPRAVSKSC